MTIVTQQISFDEGTLLELRAILNRLRDPDIAPENKLEDIAVALDAMREFLDVLDLPN